MTLLAWVLPKVIFSVLQHTLKLINVNAVNYSGSCVKINTVANSSLNVVISPDTLGKKFTQHPPQNTYLKIIREKLSLGLSNGMDLREPQVFKKGVIFTLNELIQ